MQVTIDWSKLCLKDKLNTIKALTDPYALKELAYDPDSRVREVVAGNKHTFAVILAILAYDTCEKVRVAVAKGCNGDSDILKKLLKDDSYSVRESARWEVPDELKNEL